MISAISLEEHIRSHENSLLQFYTDFLNKHFDNHTNNEQDMNVFVYVKKAKKWLENVQLTLTQDDPSTFQKIYVREMHDKTIIAGNSCTDLKSTSSCQSDSRSTVQVLDRKEVCNEESFTQGNSNQDQAIMAMKQVTSASTKDNYLPPKLSDTSYDTSSDSMTIVTKDASTQVTREKKKLSSLSKKIKWAKTSVTSLGSSFFRGENKKAFSKKDLTPSQLHLAGPGVDNVDIDSVTNLPPLQWHQASPDIDNVDIDSVTNVPSSNAQSKLFTSAKITERDYTLPYTSLNDKCLTSYAGEMFPKFTHQQDINDNQLLLTDEQVEGLHDVTPSLLPGSSQTLACCQTKLNTSITPQNDELTVIPVLPSTPLSTTEPSCSNLSDLLVMQSSCENLSSNASMEDYTSQNLISASAKSVHFILFGSCGNGKSATGNSILGGDFFKTSNQITNISDFHCQSVELDDVTISVVDCPGWNLDGDELVSEYAKRYIRTALELCNFCIDGLLFVLKFGSRFTEEQKLSVKYIKGFLGEDVMAKCGICVFTHGDLFEMEQQREEQPLTFTQWCESQTGEIQELFRECGSRYILFNNVTKDVAVLKTQVDQLLKYRDQVKSYTVEDLNKNDKMRLKFISDISRPERTTTISREIGSIRNRYLELKETDPKSETILNTLIQEISEIVNRISESEHYLQSIGKTLQQEMESKRKLLRHV